MTLISANIRVNAPLTPSLSLSLSLSLCVKSMDRSLGDEIDEEKESGMKEPLLGTNNNTSNTIPSSSSNSNKGGLRTIPFILANEGFERAASVGLAPNMILYLMSGYGLKMATGSNIIFFWNAATNFTPIIGAFLADAFVGRFRMIGFGVILSLLGMMLLWSTTIVPGARPSCDDITTDACTSPTPFQLILLYASLGLMSLGAGGIRSSTLAFGADQLVHMSEEGMKPRTNLIESFFNWYYLSYASACLFALTCVVYIQENMGWRVGFAIPVLLMFLAGISFFLASPFYVKTKHNSSLLTNFAQVLVAACRNQHYKLPSQESNEVFYLVAKGSTLCKPSEKLRFLNKACIVKDPRQELTLEGAALNPWHLCTVDQVEELKSALRIIPLWSSGIMLSVTENQQSFAVVQANSMNRHILSSRFEIPAGSFSTFSLLAGVIWLVLYDRVIVPLASRLKGQPTSFDTKTRMGAGLLLSTAFMVVAAIVEGVRRETTISQQQWQQQLSVWTPLTTEYSSRMSALWLVPQFCLIGLAGALAVTSQIEMYYTELPKSISSISSNLWGLGLCVANLVSSLIMSLIDNITKRGGHQSWISGDVDKGHYDYYYWVLASLSLLNFIYFLVCSRAYWKEEKVSHDAQEISGE